MIPQGAFEARCEILSFNTRRAAEAAIVETLPTITIERNEVGNVSAAGDAMPPPHRLLFAGTIFLGAFLLFLIEPLFAKLILPWFGGSASVWATCYAPAKQMIHDVKRE